MDLTFEKINIVNEKKTLTNPKIDVNLNKKCI